MRQRKNQTMAQHDNDEEERVVYYDLDASSHNRNSLLLVPDVVSVPVHPRTIVAASTKVAKDDNSRQIFPRQEKPLFSLDKSDDEAEKEINPFETLLQQQIQKTIKTEALQMQETISIGAMEKNNSHSFLIPCSGGLVDEEVQQETMATKGSTVRNSSKEDRTRATLKCNQQVNGYKAIGNTNRSTKLGFEGADLRPARWSITKPSPIDTKNRRKSLNAILKRRSQLTSSASKRRESMPANLSDSQGWQNQLTGYDRLKSTTSLPKGRLLSDVLQRATLLSQQQQMTSDEVLLSQQGTEGTSLNIDVILDTEHHMQAEDFASHSFPPTKPVSTNNAVSRKLKGDPAVLKIRGDIGDVIRKSLRKSNRDLTLLRSHGQHLLPQQNSHTSMTTSIGVIESIENRAYVVVCLTRYCGTLSHFAAYECHVHQVTVKLEKPTADKLMEKRSVVLQAQFHPQTAEYLQLSPGKLLKIFEPLHFCCEHVAAGSVSKPKWFLIGTQLTQVLEDNHQCNGRHTKRTKLMK